MGVDKCYTIKAILSEEEYIPFKANYNLTCFMELVFNSPNPCPNTKRAGV